MRQITLRLSDELLRLLKKSASAKGHSLNKWASLVLEASVNPDLAGDDASRLRERFERAGLLADQATTRPRRRPSSEELEKASSEAGRGRRLADLVSEGRR